MTTIDLKATALQCLTKAEQTQNFAHYTGILAMHGAARLALITGDDELMERVRGHLLPFAAGEVEFHGNFTNYYCGGNGAAWLYLHGRLPEAENDIRKQTEKTMKEAPRDHYGIFSHPRHTERIWIDVAFAVTPFLLYAGRAFEEDRCIEEAWQQTAKMVRQFRDPENGLLHQARGFNGAGNYSQDHWSRGNGWGIFALAELVDGLPADDPRRPDAEEMFVDLCGNCLAVQDDDGVFHQELTDETSFVETSGTGLILYAFGVGLAQDLLGDEFRKALIKGLRGYLSYIAVDGSVHNTCHGCCCPGNGTIDDYKKMGYPMNDPHAFGPVLFSFAQAIAIGIDTIELDQ